jgi:hypothetical protein
LIRRIIPTLLCLAGLTSAAALTLGLPDLKTAAAFFSGSAPTSLEAEAVVTLLCWAMVATLLLPAVIEMLHVLRGHAAAHHGAVPGALFLLAGVVVLCIGVMHRLMPSDSLCCGATPTRIEEAIQLAR